MSLTRYLVVAMAAAALAYAAVHIVDGLANGLVLIGALATIGTNLGKLRQGAEAAIVTGGLIALDVQGTLRHPEAGDSSLSVVLAYGAAGIVLIAAGWKLLKAAKATASAPDKPSS